MMANKDNKKLFFISNSNASKVQGSTEVYYLSHFLAERSDLHVFAPLDDPVNGAENHSLPIDGIFGVLLLNIVLLPYWLYQFFTEEPDIVYCYENVITPALLGRWIFDSTVVFDLRSDPYDQAREFLAEDDRGVVFKTFLTIGKHLHQFTLKRADHVFVLSEPLADTVVSNYGIGRDSLHLLPLGVDTDRFTPSSESYDRISIVYVGAINKQRGIDTLIEAVSGLPSEIQNKIRVDLFGNEPEGQLSYFLQRVSDDSEVKIISHGMVPHEDIPKRAGKSDIAVSPLPPYQAYQVSSPVKVFEYLAMGLPVVASRITPHERILTEAEDALLYEPESADHFRSQLVTLIDNPKMRTRFSREARQNSIDYRWEERFRTVETTLGLN